MIAPNEIKNATTVTQGQSLIVKWLTWALGEHCARTVPLVGGGSVCTHHVGRMWKIGIKGHFPCDWRGVNVVCKDGWWAVAALVNGEKVWLPSSTNASEFAPARHEFFDALATALDLAEGWDE